MYTTEGKRRNYVVLIRDKATPSMKSVDARSSKAALAITQSLTCFGGVQMSDVVTKDEFGTLESKALLLFNSAASETTVIDFENGPHGARRNQIKLVFDRAETYKELQEIIDTLEAAVSRLRAAGVWYISEEHRVYWVSLVSDADGVRSDGQLFHGDRTTGKTFLGPHPLVLHIPLTTEGSMLDILPGSHFGLNRYEFRGKGVFMTKVNIQRGEMFMHISDLMHAGVGASGKRAHKRMVVLLLPSQDRAFTTVKERDEVALTPVAYSAAALVVSSKPINGEPLPAASGIQASTAVGGLKCKPARKNPLLAKLAICNYDTYLNPVLYCHHKRRRPPSRVSLVKLAKGNRESG